MHDGKTPPIASPKKVRAPEQRVKKAHQFNQGVSGMKSGDNIFVYGTLKRGKGANQMMMGKSTFLGTDRISAKMFDLGSFPGIKIEVEDKFVSEGPTVQGELYRITDQTLVERLDSYEGYPRLYGRKEVMTEAGHRTWVYEYNHEPSERQLVPLGVWE